MGIKAFHGGSLARGLALYDSFMATAWRNNWTRGLGAKAMTAVLQVRPTTFQLPNSHYVVL